MIGKLKKSLKERCPECGKTLQIRIYQEKALERGQEIYIEKEYISCSNKDCFYERDIIEKKKGKRKLSDDFLSFD